MTRRLRTSELMGALLDEAVAKAIGLAYWRIGDPSGIVYIDVGGKRWDYKMFNPSLLWEQAGPIIERERIMLFHDRDEQDWIAFEAERDDGQERRAVGPTPLIAAMRAYVASKFGEEVELP